MRLTVMLACGLTAALLAGCSLGEPTASTESAPVEEGVTTDASPPAAPSEEPEGQESPQSEAPDDDASEEAEEPDDDESDEPEESEESEASEEAEEAAPPVVTVEGQIPGATLEVMPLRRSGDQVLLDVVLVLSPDAEEPDSESCRWASSSGCSGDGTLESPNDVQDFAGATLTDVANGQRHLVLRQSEDGECLCSRNVEQFLEPGQRYGFSATFAAPPEDVEAMTVEVPQFPAVPDVPLR